ncbi:hypothetical protein [Marinovum algicola]|uniref:hypothetical protein n=1 Tax=Marinovum algicola TaxID=42444 RepID=UPI003D2F1045
MRLDPPFVPGMEVAGVVRSAPQKSGFSAGQRVSAFTMLGGYAEQVGVAPDAVVPTPADIDDASAASLLGNYYTMQFALQRSGALHPGETVLVLGSAGGVGTAAVQIAKAMGAQTIEGAAAALGFLDHPGLAVKEAVEPARNPAPFLLGDLGALIGAQLHKAGAGGQIRGGQRRHLGHGGGGGHRGDGGHLAGADKLGGAVARARAATYAGPGDHRRLFFRHRFQRGLDRLSRGGRVIAQRHGIRDHLIDQRLDRGIAVRFGGGAPLDPVGHNRQGRGHRRGLIGVGQSGQFGLRCGLLAAQARRFARDVFFFQPHRLRRQRHPVDRARGGATAGHLIDGQALVIGGFAAGVFRRHAPGP